MFRLQVAAIFLIVLLSFPFFFFSFIGNNYIVFSIKIIALLFLAITGNISFKGKAGLIAIALFLYLCIYSIKNFNYFQGLPDFLFYFAFGFVIWALMKKNQAFRKFFIDRWLTLMAFICVSTIICGLLFLTTGNSFFSARTINEYEVFFNPLVGALNIGRIRPEWYFSEPNFLGTYLALCFPILVECFPTLSKRRKIMLSILWLGATILVNSYGALLALGIGIISYVFYRLFRVNDSIFKLLIVVVVIAGVFMIPNLDTSEMRSDYEEIASSSLNDRQERTADSQRMLSEMDVMDFLFGKGLNSIGEKTGKGASMVYYSIIIEWGLLFTILYFVIVFALLKKNNLALLILLANFFCTEGFLNPLIILSLFIISLNQSNTNNNHIKPLVNNYA